MEKNKKTGATCTSHRCEIVGAIFLVIATVLTLLTFSGVGILGMFIVGAIFCSHKHMGYGRCNCGCSCCAKDVKPVVEVKKEPAARKPAAKK